MSLWIMRWCGSMLYQVHGGVCAMCCAERDSLCTAHFMDLIYNMLPHHHIIHNDVLLMTVL